MRGYVLAAVLTSSDLCMREKKEILKSSYSGGQVAQVLLFKMLICHTFRISNLVDNFHFIWISPPVSLAWKIDKHSW